MIVLFGCLSVTRRLSSFSSCVMAPLGRTLQWIQRRSIRTFCTGDWFLCLTTSMRMGDRFMLWIKKIDANISALCKIWFKVTLGIFNYFHIIFYPCSHSRGILQTSSYTMTLWKGPSQSGKLVLPDGPVYQPNPCSPGNSNPDDRAIKVTVLFPRHSYPVFFPSSGAETHAFLLRYHPCLSVVCLFVCLSVCLSVCLMCIAFFLLH